MQSRFGGRSGARPRRAAVGVAVPLVTFALLWLGSATMAGAVDPVPTTTTTTVVGNPSTTVRPTTTTTRPGSTTTGPGGSTTFPPTTVPPTTGPPTTVPTAPADRFTAAIGSTTNVAITDPGHTGEIRITNPDGSDPAPGTAVVASWTFTGFPANAYLESTAPDRYCNFSSVGISSYIADTGSGLFAPIGRFVTGTGPATLRLEPLGQEVGALSLKLELAPPDNEVTVAAGQPLTTLTVVPGQLAVVHLTNADGTELAAGTRGLLGYTTHGFGSIGDEQADLFSASACFGGQGGSPNTDFELPLPFVTDGGLLTFTYRSPMTTVGTLDLRFTTPPDDSHDTLTAGQHANITTAPGQGAYVELKKADGSDPVPNERVTLTLTSHGYADPARGYVSLWGTTDWATAELGPNGVAVTATATAAGGPLQLHLVPWDFDEGSVDVDVSFAPPVTTTTGTTVPTTGPSTTIPGTTTPFPTTTGVSTTTRPTGPTTTRPTTTTTRAVTTTSKPITTTTAPPATTTTTTTTKASTTTTTKPTTTEPWYVQLVRFLLCVLFRLCP